MDVYVLPVVLLLLPLVLSHLGVQGQCQGESECTQPSCRFSGVLRTWFPHGFLHSHPLMTKELGSSKNSTSKTVLHRMNQFPLIYLRQIVRHLHPV